jgi:hypothetical protein
VDVTDAARSAAPPSGEDALTTLARLLREDMEEANRVILARMDSPVALIPQLAAGKRREVRVVLDVRRGNHHGARLSELEDNTFKRAQASRALGVTSGPRDDGGAPGFADVAEKVVPAVVSIER